MTKYKVTWKNANGDVLEEDSVEKGKIPTYKGATPTLVVPGQTNTFIGWDKVATEVTADTTYTAVYSTEKSKYTVFWKNYNGDVLETDSNVEYGTIPTYDHNDPTRPNEGKFSYEFIGWDKEITAVTGDITYTARYRATLNTYTITWKNWDGTILGTDTEFPYGSTPVYTYATPTKAADAEYTYTFVGWTPSITEFVGDATYVAKFRSDKNKYNVIWKNWDGTDLEKDENVLYGSTISYDSIAPTRNETGDYIYTFKGWSRTANGEIITNFGNVTGNETFYAVFEEIKNNYTITWKNWDGTELKKDTNVKYEATISYGGTTPTKNATAEYTYTFKGWSRTATGEVITDFGTVNKDEIFYAVFEATRNKYDVTFVVDGTQTVVKYEYGETIATPTAPVKQATAQYTYTFKGWSKTLNGEVVTNLGTVTGNATFYAVFDSTINKYTVTWKNWDGSILETDKDVEYGTKPKYDGNTPTRSSTLKYTYTWKNWDNQVTDVVGDAVYTATFDHTINKYTITWVNYDDAELYKEDVEYDAKPEYKGATPTKASSIDYDYEFDGWDKEIVTVTGKTTYKATFKQVERIHIYEISIKSINPNEAETSNGYDTTTIGTIYYKYVVGVDGYYSDSECKNKITNFTYDYDHFTLKGLYTKEPTNNGHSYAKSNGNALIVNGSFVVGNGIIFTAKTDVYALVNPKSYKASFELVSCTYGTTTGTAPSAVDYYYNEPFASDIALTMPENNYFDATYKKGDTVYFDINGKPTNNPFKYGTNDNTLAINWVKKDNGYVYVTNKAELRAVEGGTAGTNYLIICDINLNGEQFDTISGVYGNINGDGHKIYNFSINEVRVSGNQYVAVFEYLAPDCTIENLIIGDDSSTINMYAEHTEASGAPGVLFFGGLVGYSNGIIKNCTVNNIKMVSELYDKNNNEHLILWQGGAIGWAAGGVVEGVKVINSELHGTLYAQQDSGDDQIGSIGGIAGQSSINISKCLFKNGKIYLTVRGDGDYNNISYPCVYIGGILGSQAHGIIIENDVIDCYMEGIGSHGGWTSPSFSLGKAIGHVEDDGQGEQNREGETWGTYIMGTPPIYWHTEDAGVIVDSGDRSDNVGVLFKIERKK